MAISSKFSVVVFSSGSGKRLRPKTFSLPKLFVKIGKKSIFDYTVKQFIRSKFCTKTYIVYRNYKHHYLHLIKKFNFINLIKNSYPPSSHCASSLYTVYKRLDGNIVFFNSDLMLSNNNINFILKNISNTKQSLVFGFSRNTAPRECDLPRLQTNKNAKVIKWSMVMNNFDWHLTGPVFLNHEDTKIMKEVLDKINKNEIIKSPCFTFFSTLINKVDYHFKEIEASGYVEIDNHNDLKDSLSRIWVN